MLKIPSALTLTGCLSGFSVLPGRHPGSQMKAGGRPENLGGPHRTGLMTLGLEDIINTCCVHMCKLSAIDFRRGCCAMIRVYQDYLRITALPSGISAGAPVCDARPSLSRHALTLVSGLNPPRSDGENVPFMKITDIQMCQVSPLTGGILGSVSGWFKDGSSSFTRTLTSELPGGGGGS